MLERRKAAMLRIFAGWICESLLEPYSIVIEQCESKDGLDRLLHDDP